MQKWEYLYVIKTRGYEVQEQLKEANMVVGSKWTYFTQARGQQDRGTEWEGDNPCDFLCELGDQGWELVSESSRSDFIGIEGDDENPTINITGFTSSIEYVFKRPKD